MMILYFHWVIQLYIILKAHYIAMLDNKLLPELFLYLYQLFKIFL